MKKSDFKFLIGSFLSWRIILFIVSFFSTILIPVFGNRFPYADRVLEVTKLPSWIWGFGNFDGVHYLRIAQNLYSSDFTQAFFPLYPLIIRFFNIFPKNGFLNLRLFTDPSYFYTAMVLSVIIFATALYFLFKLFSETYGKQIAKISILILLSFPTAFYFGSVYSESLFLLLTVLTFWFVKKDNFIVAGIFAALASATKIQGVLLLVFLIIELISKYKEGIKKLRNEIVRDILGIILAPSGLIFYMIYLKNLTGNYFYFLTSQPAFGAERSSIPMVLLPQVIYRYFKIIFTVNPLSLPFFNAFMELSLSIVVITLLIIAFKKMRFSYWLFSFLVVVLPTLTGTLSSMPRYVLLVFMLIPFIAEKFKKRTKYIIIVQSVLQIILLGLFVRGYWVA